MRKVFICAIIVFVCADSLLEGPIDGAETIRPKYSISTNENPNARLEFELKQVVDPKTNSLPSDIRRKELRFARSHISRNQLQNQRSSGILAEDWESIGPLNVGGRTRAVALDVSDPSENTILAGGVSGGVWKSTDGGQIWRRTSDPEHHNSVMTIVQDIREGKQHIWYYGTGELVGNSARGTGAPYRGDGIFKSVDGGESWFQLASTHDSEPSTFGSQFQYSWRLVTDSMDPTNDVILAATYGAILRSEDGGDTWDTMLGVTLRDLPDDTDLNQENAPFFTDLVQTDEGYFYAFLSNQTTTQQSFIGGGLFFSEDGETWHNISGPTDTFQKQRAVLGVHENELYYFFIGDGNPRLFKSVLTDVDEFGIPTGEWENLTNNLPVFGGLGNLDLQGGYNMVVKVLPSDPSTVLLGATNLYRSTDGFSTADNTEWIGGYNPETGGGSLYPNHHPDQHDILFFEGNSNKVLTANDGGLYITNNVLATDVQWISLNNGFVTSQFYTINIPKTDDSPFITGGLQDNGTQLINIDEDDSDWTMVLGGDGAFTASVPLNLHWYFSFQNSQIYRLTYTDESSSFARIDPTGGASLTGSEYLFINPYVLDPINANIMYLAAGNAIWKNSNLGQIQDGSQATTDVNWSFLNSTLVERGLISALEASSNGSYLYYGTSEGEFYRLEDPSNRTIGTNQNLTHSILPEGYIACIASNPESDSEILIVFSNYGVPSLFHSSDAGFTFENIGGNLEEFADGTGNGPSVRWAEIVPLVSGTRYFVGTSVGLYSTDVLNGNETTWVKESPDAIGKSVIRMMDYRPLDGRLVIATHGNGVFMTNVKGFKELPAISPNAPDKFKVANAYPNPFQELVEIEFEIPETSFVWINIYDAGGNFIKLLFYNVQFTGSSSVTWDGTNQYGSKVQPGMYFYRMYYNDQRESGRIVYAP